MAPRVFERDLGLDGKLRLPGYLWNEYDDCYLSLGLFSDTYLQLTPDGVYLLIDEAITGKFTDRQAFRLQRNFHTGTKLKMDSVGRVQIPLSLLKRAGMKPGAAVIGEAGPSSGDYRPNQKPNHPAYWTLEDKLVWLGRNPSGQYTLDYLNARY